MEYKLLVVGVNISNEELYDKLCESENIYFEQQEKLYEDRINEIMTEEEINEKMEYIKGLLKDIKS